MARDNYEEWSAVVDYYGPFFHEAGFGDYAIDFSGIDKELVEELGEVVKDYVGKERKDIV